MKKFIFFILGTLLFSCKTTEIKKKAILQDPKSHLGIYITDTKSGQVLFDYQGTMNFVPASNTKILTLYAALKTMGDSLPAFRYNLKNDTLFVQGTGDPTLLHPDFDSKKALEVLSRGKVIVISDRNWFQEPYGQGWAWDDYNDYYQAELSSLPVYGNIIRIKSENGQPVISPPFFSSNLKEKPSGSRVVRREIDKNIFYYDPAVTLPKTYTQEIPLKVNFVQTAEWLSRQLNKSVIYDPEKISTYPYTAYSVPTDTVLRKMMWESDNFLAEQLLLLAGGTFSDTLNTANCIKHITLNILGDVGQPFKWVDGSGLSRYNLFSPQIMTVVLNRLYQEIGQDRLFSLMSIGGKAGTLRNKYKEEVPYVYAKTGSMGGVYNESGYLVAKSGRLLTYSVMKNNFTGTVSENGKKTMELIQWLRNKYYKGRP